MRIPDYLRDSNAAPRSGHPWAARGQEWRRQILQGLADDLSPKQIAAASGCSRRAVKYHLMLLRNISGSMTAAGLVAWAFRKGLVK